MTMIEHVVIHILESTDQRGIVIEYFNPMHSTVKVSVPHPRESLWLQFEGEDLPKSFYPLTWDSMNPLTLQPNVRQCVAIRLVPYWLDINGVCNVSLRVRTENEDGELSEQTANALISLCLPSMAELRHETRGSSPEKIPQQELLA